MLLHDNRLVRMHRLAVLIYLIGILVSHQMASVADEMIGDKHFIAGNDSLSPLTAPAMLPQVSFGISTEMTGLPQKSLHYLTLGQIALEQALGE